MTRRVVLLLGLPMIVLMNGPALAQQGAALGQACSLAGALAQLGRPWQVAQVATDQKCEVSSACRTIAALQQLILAGGSPDRGSLAKFTADFDPLFGRLSNKELACRFNVAPQYGAYKLTIPLIGQIHRDRFGLKTVSDRSLFPDTTSCAFAITNYPPRPGERERCDDASAIERVMANLGYLAGTLRCPAPSQAAAGQHRLCPDTTMLTQMKLGADRAVNVTQFLAQVSRNKAARDEALRSAFEDTLTGFKQLSSVLGSVIKAGNTCQELLGSLNALSDFRDAVDEINGAGCSSEKLANGFDKLVRSAGVLGQKTLAKELAPLKPVFELMAKNQNFFAKTSGALNPEHRWSRQFGGTDGYIPNCPASMQAASR